MPQDKKSSSKWFWIVILLALFVVTIVWLADPLGDVTGSPSPEPTANPTEWAPAPTGPAVEVNLPETPLKNTPAQAGDNPSD